MQLKLEHAVTSAANSDTVSTKSTSDRLAPVRALITRAREQHNLSFKTAASALITACGVLVGPREKCHVFRSIISNAIENWKQSCNPDVEQHFCVVDQHFEWREHHWQNSGFSTSINPEDFVGLVEGVIAELRSRHKLTRREAAISFIAGCGTLVSQELGHSSFRKIVSDGVDGWEHFSFPNDEHRFCLVAQTTCWSKEHSHEPHSVSNVRVEARAILSYSEKDEDLAKDCWDHWHGGEVQPILHVRPTISKRLTQPGLKEAMQNASVCIVMASPGMMDREPQLVHLFKTAFRVKIPVRIISTSPLVEWQEAMIKHLDRLGLDFVGLRRAKCRLFEPPIREQFMLSDFMNIRTETQEPHYGGLPVPVEAPVTVAKTSG